jgi:ceramide glucosyltransferase
LQAKRAAADIAMANVIRESSSWLIQAPMTMLVLSACAFCVMAVFLHLASIVAVTARIRRSGAEAVRGQTVEGVSIVRPVCGIDNFTEETLLSGFRLEYPNYEILFCVAQSSDPVVPLVRRLIELHPGVPARLLVGTERISTNPKLNNVVKGWIAASHAWIVMADSNVLMPPDYLHRLLRSWRADTGLVSSPPIGCAPGNVWAELECAFLNTYQARWQCFADGVGMGFAQGKTMLFRRDILESAGGIRALAFDAAEDAASTKLVRKNGLRVRLVDRPFPQPLGYRTAAEVWRRQMRWARLRRDTFRYYFVPEIMAGGVPPLAACAIFAASNDWSVVGALTVFGAIWYGAEIVLAYAAGWHLSWRSPFLWLFRDLLLPVLWSASWLGNEFVWRGNSMRVVDRNSAA